MDLKSVSEELRYVCRGANCHVYEISPVTVVKVPRAGDEEKERFDHEIAIWDILSRHPPCPSLITCFLCCEKGIFLEYMRDIDLSMRMQRNQIRDHRTRQVLEVKMLETLDTRKRWLIDLSRGVAHLESLGLAHGDLRPANVLIDRDRLKLSDFDCTMEIGSDNEVGVAPYGRLVGDEEPASKGSMGQLGPRSEQFALGSLFYMINYGFKVYEDQLLGKEDNNRDQEEVMTRLLQKMCFSKLDGEPAIDSIIRKCWYGEYQTVGYLAAETAELFRSSNGISNVVTNGHSTNDISFSEFSVRKQLCDDMIERGILEALSGKDPEELGIRAAWRYLEPKVSKG